MPPPGLLSSGFHLPHLSAAHTQTRKIPARERRPCPFPGSPCLKSGQSCRHRGQPEIKTSLGQVWAGRGTVSGLGPNTLRQQVWALGEVGWLGSCQDQVQHSLGPRLGDGLYSLPHTTPAQTAALQCGTAGTESLFLEWRLCPLLPEQAKASSWGHCLMLGVRGQHLAGSGRADLGPEITWSPENTKTTAQRHHHRHYLMKPYQPPAQSRTFTITHAMHTHTPCAAPSHTGTQPQIQTALTQNLMCGQHLLSKQ